MPGASLVLAHATDEGPTRVLAIGAGRRPHPVASRAILADRAHQVGARQDGHPLGTGADRGHVPAHDETRAGPTPRGIN